nr:hypothetical protein [Brevundimonas diminuta]
MIYRVVDAASGAIVRSLDADPAVAARYLEPGQLLVEAGTTLHVNDTALEIRDGRLMRKASAPDVGYADEGAVAVLIETHKEG